MQSNEQQLLERRRIAFTYQLNISLAMATASYIGAMLPSSAMSALLLVSAFSVFTFSFMHSLHRVSAYNGSPSERPTGAATFDDTVFLQSYAANFGALLLAHAGIAANFYAQYWQTPLCPVAMFVLLASVFAIFVSLSEKPAPGQK